MEELPWGATLRQAVVAGRSRRGGLEPSPVASRPIDRFRLFSNEAFIGFYL